MSLVSSNRPRVVVVGFIGKLPYAGMSLYNLHYISGLKALGYDVHYVERINKPQECYDPISGTATDNPAFAVNYLRSLLTEFSFIDRENRCQGSDWNVLRAKLREADFVITLADPTWFDELEICSRRAFVDGDPMFTQICSADVLAHYTTLFSYATRMGMADCTVPQLGRTWIPTRPVVATDEWKVMPVRKELPITALMHWASGKPIFWDGREYGHKNREFERFIDLPMRANRQFAIALGGRTAPREQILRHGWQLLNPLEATRTIDSYHAFIAESWADFGIAKHAYVASRSGWFSDRSTCFLAAGRPILHQDTGCGDWLRVGEGVLLFSDAESALEGLREIERDYERHVRAARAVAEEFFEARIVVGQMLEDAGFR